MLKNLRIDNYALIDHLEIDFEAGMSVITGETGAGKSIILGALSMVLGSRAEAKLILSDNKKCVVEATFDVSQYHLQSLFQSLDVDYDSECILRREVTASGKSRAFVNDTPVNLSQLRSVSSLLIDIHSQHENLLLSEADFQLDIVDTIANTDLELKTYHSEFIEYKNSLSLLKEIKESAERLLEEKDYAEFQLAELQEARLDNEEEQEALEEEQNTLNHSQDISEGLSQILGVLSAEQYGVLPQIKQVGSTLRKIGGYMPSMNDLADRISSSIIEIEDITNDIERTLSNTEFSAERKMFVEERLNLIYSLQQKHRVQSIAELIAKRDDFAQKLQKIESSDEDIIRLEKEIATRENTLKKLAGILTDKRIEAKPIIEHSVSHLLGELGMANGAIEVRFFELQEFSAVGKDRVELLFSANKNRDFQPISQVASGGEISRLMLAIKSLLAKSKALPTIIFDEIDTGISGEIAKKMGQIIHDMSSRMQVFSITHLPQIACRGDFHYKVFKKDTEEATQTHIERLSKEARVRELAEMIDGKNPSESALSSAKEMLNQ